MPVSQVPVLTACVPCRGRSRLETTVSESRNGSSGFRIGLNSKPAPVVFGVQWLGRSPIGTNTAPKRRGGFAAVCAVRRQRRHHGVEQRQRQCGAHAAQDRPPRNDILVMNMI